MKNFKVLFGLLAIVITSIAAYSFTVKKTVADVKPDDQASVWIKYDCKESPGVTIVSSGTNYTFESNPDELPGYSPNCPGQVSVCARLFPAANVEDHPTMPGNKVPKSGLGETQIDQRRCVSIVP